MTDNEITTLLQDSKVAAVYKDANNKVLVVMIKGNTSIRAYIDITDITYNDPAKEV